MTKNNISSALLFFLLLLGFAPSVQAEEENHISPHGPYHLSVVLADTHIDGEGNNPTIGIDFEYRMNQLLGLGSVIEYAWGELDASTFLAVADIHLHEGWVIQVGPGFEHREGEDVFVSRAGLLYEFEWENFTLSPQLHWDYHQHEESAVVAGFALGFSF